MPRPIFVMGIQRSGTTWLANELANMTQTVGVASGRYGTRESHYFNQYVSRFGDITQLDNFVIFASVLLQSDFFILAGLDKEIIESLYRNDYPTIFYEIMTRYTEEHQAQYWVEKTPEHTALIDKIYHAYPDALFVATRRNRVDVFTSTIIQERLWDNTPRRLRRMLSHALRHTYYDKTIARFARQHENIVVVDYDDMKADMPQVMMRMIDTLNLGTTYDPIQQQAYEKNTSYRLTDFTLPAFEQRILHFIYQAASLIPLFILTFIFRCRLKSERRRGLPIDLFRSNFPQVAKADPIVAEIIESDA